MTGQQTFKVGVIGASGYTGADLIRLAHVHPAMQIVALAAKAHAGQPLSRVFPHLGMTGLPDLQEAGDIDWSDCDVVFCGLPHGTAHQVIVELPNTVKVVDMSADFRLRDTDVYAEWYGGPHGAPDLLRDAVYGLTEYYSADIANARLVACPGCYPTAALLALLPLVGAGLVEADDIVMDAKSGVSGAGRSLKQNTMFTEAGEGLSPYAVGTHRHAPEIEQELSRVAGHDVVVNFTPHLVPMSRGELITSYVRLTGDATPDDLRQALAERYASARFVRVLDAGDAPTTQHVRGSNYCSIGVFPDRIKGRAIVISALDNLVKGSAGQAVQNFNLMSSLPEETGLEQLPLFP